MNPVLLIEKKRQGGTHSVEELAHLISGYVAGTIPDYQMAAWAMAVFFQGLDDTETVALTRLMLESGDRLDWSGRPGIRVDKHSTGGIGDKVSLILAPMLAAVGLEVPMISGRSLGATGGTLDKLQAIPGFRTDLTVDEFQRITTEVGFAMAGQTARLVPADRQLYALRDATATVPSIPLITASILSKKLAEGLDALVLDVKWGTGAFMKSLDQARALATCLVAVGRGAGLATRAVLTDMNQPLGVMVGNAVEVQESLDILNNRGPADVREVTLVLGEELLVAVGRASSPADARTQLESTLANGSARDRFEQMVVAQGGRLADLPAPASATPVVADRPGFVQAIDGDRLGYAIVELGGGRKQTTDTIDSTVGLAMRVRLGDRVEVGQPLVDILAGTKGREAALAMVRSAFRIGEEPTQSPALIVDRL